MKCEKCGNEATFHYQSNINGEKTEVHFCTECAKAEGFGDMLSYRPRMFSGLFGSTMGGLMSDFMREPFGAITNGFWGEPFGGDLFAALMPPREQSCEQPQEATKSQEKNDHNIPKDAGEVFRAKRELSALKHQLKSAVNAEE
ncbi:MAG: hypothetical protein RR731_03655, partial [Oscillospiraceae bacterium]